MEVINLFKNEAGVSAFCTFAGFNVCGYAGAEPESIESDLKRLKEMTFPCDIFIPRQTHSVRVARPGDNLEGVDALVSDRPGELLCISTADCLPLLLYDPISRVIGAAHCGWRGTVGAIAQKTMEEMERLGAVRSRTLAAVGPFICPECFEVGPEVAAQFPNEAVISTEGSRPHVDLLTAVKLQLPEVKFTDSAGCSMCSPRFYSVRRQGRDLPYRTLTAIKLL